MAEREIVFEIKEHLGVLAKNPTGWTKELNLISWNGQAPKFDIRDWDPAHERMSRGVTLHPRELNKIVEYYLSNKNKKVIEEAQAAEAEKWNRIAARKKQSEESEGFEEVSADEFSGDDIPAGDIQTDTIPTDDIPADFHMDTSPLTEVPQQINDSTPF